MSPHPIDLDYERHRRSLWVGLCHAFASMLLWGILPIYWYLLRRVEPQVVLANRIFWAWILLSVFLVLRGKLGDGWRACTQHWRTLGLQTVAALLIGCNWMTYIWAIKNHFVLETSLGYFINPMISVLLGAVVLNEKLHRWQWLAFCTTAVAIVYQIFAMGTWPWVALILAGTFSVYSLIKKVTKLDSITGLWFETMLSLIPAMIIFTRSEAVFGGTWMDSALLFGCGLVTLLPMLFFAEAARRLPLSFLGFLQYLAPTLQFLIAIFFFNDRPNDARMMSFMVVWFSVALFLYGQHCTSREKRRQRGLQIDSESVRA